MKNRDLAEKIYNDLNKRGAGLGNASIGMIEKTLDEQLAIQRVSNRFSEKEIEKITIDMVKQLTGKDVAKECFLQGDADAQICFNYLNKVNNGC